MVYFVIGTILAVALTVALFLYAFNGDAWSEGAGAIGVLSAIGSVILIAITVAVGFASAGAGTRAALLNESYGTHYTADQLFYGDDIIKEVIQGRLSRIQLDVKQK